MWTSANDLSFLSKKCEGQLPHPSSGFFAYARLPLLLEANVSEGTSIHDDGSNDCIRLVRYHATAVLPIATVLTFAAAAIVYATYEAPKIGLTLAVFLLGLTYLALWRLVMPRIRKLHQIDMVAFAVYGLAVGCTWIGLLAGHGTPLSCGLLIVLSATAFVRHRSYATFVAIALTGYTSIAIWMDHFGRIELQLLIISPWFGVIGRLFLFRVSDEVTTARERMRSSLAKMQRSQLDHMLAEKKLVHAETMEQLGLIAANVAHDFNNSLQSISMLAEQIRLGIDLNRRRSKSRKSRIPRPTPAGGCWPVPDSRTMR